MAIPFLIGIDEIQGLTINPLLLGLQDTYQTHAEVVTGEKRLNGNQDPSGKVFFKYNISCLQIYFGDQTAGPGCPPGTQIKKFKTKENSAKSIRYILPMIA